MENATTQKQPTQIWEKKDLYQQVTDSIIQQLEKGTVPWRQPWIGNGGPSLSIPANFTTGNYYRGINIVLLWNSAINNNFTSPEWASFKQWNDRKEAIRKGEKGSMVVYYDTMEKEVDGELKKIPFLKSSVVFNRCQLVNYKADEVIENTPSTALKVELISRAEIFVNNTGADIQHGHSRACYIPATDKIQMPSPEAFIGSEACTAQEAYYSTMFHELTHWTSQPSRTGRKTGKVFGDQDYATEELVAELGAAFLSAKLQITEKPTEDHAGYIAHWLKVLKENNRCIFKAASEASKAVEFLQGLQPN